MSKYDQDEASLDTIFDLLSNPRRRFVLHLLQQRDEPMSLSELAAQVAARENDVPAEELTSQQRKRTYVSLYQTHIPKLEEVGVITYDSDSGMVALTDRAHQIDEHIHGSQSDVPWQGLYLATAAIGLGAYLLAILLGLEATIRIGIGLVVLGAVVAIAIVHYIESRRSEGYRFDLIEE